MKYIQKNGCPEKYTLWCKSVVDTDEEDYNELKGVNKQILFDALIKEQGFICGYTMKKINRDTAHIEHIKPQSLCRREKPGSDLDYTNLIACYPLKDNKAKYRYGATKKGDWWEKGGKEFVSPLEYACESYFHFDLEGKIIASTSNIAAINTIKVLALNHGSLTEERKRVIEEFIHGPYKKDPLSPSQTTRAISNICNQNGEGHYHEFCIVIRDALKQHLSGLEKNRRQNKYSQRKN